MCLHSDNECSDSVSLPFLRCQSSWRSGWLLPRQAVSESCLVQYVSKETTEDLMMRACPKNTRRDDLNIEMNDVVFTTHHTDKPSDAQSTIYRPRLEIGRAVAP